MKTSEQLGDLATALALAQGDISDAIKDSRNPHFNSVFASLESVLKEIRPVFSTYGLCIIQAPRSDELGHYLDTRILHKSGQWIEETVRLTLFKADMQGLGSAITYARRYSAGAFAGIGSETDDDANSISEPPKTYQKTSPPVKVKPIDTQGPKVKNEAPVGGQEVANLVTALERKGKSRENLCKYFGVEELGYLKIYQYAEAMEMLNGN